MESGVNEVRTAVRRMLDEGHNDQEVKAAMRNSGYSDDQIDLAFITFKKKEKKEASLGRRLFLVLLVFFWCWFITHIILWVHASSSVKVIYGMAIGPASYIELLNTLALLSWPLLVLGVIIFLAMLIDCAMRDSIRGGKKVGFILTILLLGTIGATIYYLAYGRKPL